MHNALNPSGRTMSADEVARVAQERLALEEQIAWLERLDSNKDFQRFLDIFRKVSIDTKLKAQDTALPTEQRLALTDRFFGVDQVTDWHARQLEVSRATLKALRERLAAAAR